MIWPVLPPTQWHIGMWYPFQSSRTEHKGMYGIGYISERSDTVEVMESLPGLFTLEQALDLCRKHNEGLAQ